MIPQLVTVRVTRPDRRPIRIWIPVLPVVLLLSPLLVLGVLAGAVACRMYQISFPRALGTAWRIVSALPGTRLDVDESGTGLLIAIR